LNPAKVRKCPRRQTDGPRMAVLWLASHRASVEQHRAYKHRDDERTGQPDPIREEKKHHACPFGFLSWPSSICGGCLRSASAARSSQADAIWSRTDLSCCDIVSASRRQSAAYCLYIFASCISNSLRFPNVPWPKQRAGTGTGADLEQDCEYGHGEEPNRGDVV